MLSIKGRKRLEAQLGYLQGKAKNIVADADTHITDISNLNGGIKKQYEASQNYYQGRPISVEELLSEMDMSSVDIALCWQNPACTLYRGEQNEYYESLLYANSYIFDSAIKYPERIIPAGWTDPSALALELSIKLVEICVNEFGFPIVKMNPAQNEFPIESDTVLKTVEHIIKLGAVPAFHFGADTEFTPAKGLESIAKTFSPNPIIGVHMGGGGGSYLDSDQLYADARELGLRKPNIWFIQSAKRDVHMESDFITYQLAGKEARRRIFCASDAPYGRVSWNFGGFRTMFESLKQTNLHPDKRVRENPNLFDDESIRGYLGVNFTEFIIERYKILLHR